MRKLLKKVLIYFLMLGLIISCSGMDVPVPENENHRENEIQTETVLPTPTNEILVEPTPPLDFSEWYIKIGEMQCRLELLEDSYPERFLAVCPEEVWLPISQITQVDVIMGEYCLDLKSVEDFIDVIEKHFPGVQQIEFVEMQDGQWGCQVPYSDQAGIEIVCGIGCEEIGIILNVKTIRNSSSGSGGSGSSSGNNSSWVPPTPDPNG